MGFEIRLRQRAARKISRFVGWHNVEVFSLLPAQSSHVYVTVPCLWLRFKCFRLFLYRPHPFSLIIVIFACG